MALTAAERMRRSRAHSRGDHSLCDPSRGCGSGVTVTPVAQPARNGVTPPGGLRVRGRRLWDELATATTPPGHRVLIEEACRIADRLEQLDRVLRGDAAVWLRLFEDVETGEVTLIVDKALSESRQQQIALKLLVAEIRQAIGASAPSAPSGPVPVKQGGSIRDDLRARREARIADAAGR